MSSGRNTPRPACGNFHYNHALLTEPQRDRIDVVLVSPRNPLNIGAAARAMANFGFSRLTVVAPYEPHWREAKSAVGAEELLQNARKHGAPGRGRGRLHPGRRHRQPSPIANRSSRSFRSRSSRRSCSTNSPAAAASPSSSAPEKRGLTREDLALCHLLVEIPTDPRQPSMNLGQAVAVCLYEIAARLRRAPIRRPRVRVPER